MHTITMEFSSLCVYLCMHTQKGIGRIFKEHFHLQSEVIVQEKLSCEVFSLNVLRDFHNLYI